MLWHRALPALHQVGIPPCFPVRKVLVTRWPGGSPGGGWLAGAAFGEHPWLWDEILGLLFISAAAVGLYFHADRRWIELAEERFSFNKP